KNAELHTNPVANTRGRPTDIGLRSSGPAQPTACVLYGASLALGSVLHLRLPSDLPRGIAPAFGVGFRLSRLQKDFHLPLCVHAGRNLKHVLAPSGLRACEGPAGALRRIRAAIVSV